MTISRGKRFLGFLINAITFQGLIIGNLILLLTSGKTVGGLVAGYKYESTSKVLVLWLTKMLTGVLYVITFGIFWIVDIATMAKKDGTYGEVWASNRKVALSKAKAKPAKK